jgi:phosphatidylserine decarboxylase
MARRVGYRPQYLTQPARADHERCARSLLGLSEVGQVVDKGQIFGMIRVGSQVDLIVPDLPGLTVKVAPGDRVVAGETVLAE